MKDKIYVPDLSSYKCVYMYQNNVLRAYKQIPSYNTEIDYTDFFIENHYLYRDGTQSFSSYSTLPNCLSSSVLTNDFYYRTDFADICIIFLIFSIFILYLPIKVIFRFFRRFN